MALYGGCCVLLSLLLFLISSSADLRVRSEFNQRGVRGSIEFSQDDPTDSTLISVNLTGLRLHPDTLFQWHIHQYPFPLDGLPNPCRTGVTGGHYDPLGANFNSSIYPQRCAQNPQSYCEIGDLSGKFGLLNVSDSDTVIAEFDDPSLSLHGIYSVVGRSIVIHLSNGARLVCANIDYPQDTPTAQNDILYSPFRSNFAGAIYFRGHTDSNTSSVYSDLLRVSGDSDSAGHNWHVHELPLDVNGTNCYVTGPHYNPLNANVTSGDYEIRCNSTMQENCEIGDLSNKGAPYNVVNGVAKHFYTDTALPLTGDPLYIVNRSVVIHAENRAAPRISCANITRYTPLEATVTFNETGITGEIRFFQPSPFDPTMVSVNLNGLGGRAGGYHVHVTPVPPDGNQRCDLAQGHWNPTGVVYNDTVTRPLTSDEYEVGDLSGKFGGLDNRDDIMETYFDPTTPLFGKHSIVGRSVVIHWGNGSRLTCENIRLVRPVLRVETVVNTSTLRGRIVFSQPADDPYAETTITVELEVLQVINVTTPTPSPTPSQTVTSTLIQTSAVDQTASLSLSAIVNSTSVFQVPSPSQTTQSIPMSSSFQFQTSQFVPVSSSNMDIGSGDSMLPFGPTSVMTTSTVLIPVVSPTPANMGRRRRHVRARRQAPPPQMVGFDWSVRTVDGNLPSDCSSLPVFQPVESNPDLCTPLTPLACGVGDLTGKHGPLSLPSQPTGRYTAVFTDPALPLSGPRSPFTNVQAAILVQPMGEDLTGGATACSVAMEIEEVAPPTTEAPSTTEATPTPETLPTVDTTQPTLTETTPTEQITVPSQPADNTVVVIGAAVGGALGALLIIIIVIIILVLCCRGRSSGYKVSKQSALELGTVRPSKPILGVPNYRALHDYSPQNNDDLQLSRGEWVALIETPLGGGWWKGSVEGRGEGWFPRTYVEYVDVEAEKKKREEENFLMAASAIMAASTSFNSQHPSLTQTQNRQQTMPAKSKRAFSFSKKKEEKVDLEGLQRAHTFSRKLDIDSTPRAPRKLDKPYLAEDNDNNEATIIANEGGEIIANGDNLPDTPDSQKKAALFVNTAAAEGSPVLPRASEQEGDTEQETDRYIVKYDFSGSTDIELELTKDAVVMIIERSDGGWWKGVCEGKVGWFPESYVRPAPVETKPPIQPASMEETMKTGEDLEATEYRAIFPYQSDTEGDVEFGEGETVWVYWAQDNGWWYGAVGSAQGWFPGSFVEPVIDIPTPNETLERNKTRSSFKKMWSLRRKSRDKTKDSDKTQPTEEAGNNEEKLPSGAQGGSLEGQLQAALERRRSFGRERNLAVDEQVANGHKGEPQKSRAEMVADFVRRSFKKSKSRDREREEGREEEELVKNEETGNKETVENKEVTEKAAAKQPPPPVAVKAASRSAPSPKQRRDNKSRRAPPPPPGTTPIKQGSVQPEPLKEEPSPVLPKAEVATPTSSVPSKEEPSSKLEAAKPQPPKEKPSPKTKVPPSPSRQAPQTSSTPGEATKAAPSPSITQRNANQPIPQPRKRHSKAALTQRRPPPPPPGTTNAATPTLAPKEPSSQVTSAEETKTPPTSEPTRASKPAQPPVPPRSSLRPRIQKVKRPISRMIPPPPNIPLPPPPVRKVGGATPPTAVKETVKPEQAVKKVGGATTLEAVKETVKSEQATPAPTPLARTLSRPEQTATPTKEPEQAPTTTSTDTEAKKPSKPPVAPKPSHLRRVSAPALEGAPQEPQPTDEPPAKPVSEPQKSPRPKPLPPARSSSLATRPTPMQRKPASTSVLPKIEDTKEEVDSPPQTAKVELDEANMKATRSAPPRRPPPPRPASVASNKTNRIEDPSQSQGATAAPIGGRVLYSATDAQPDEKDGVGHAVKTKGSSLMRSLKKMVTRDSRKGSEKASKDEHAERTPTQTADSAQNVPKPRPRAVETTTQGQESPGSKPARPPPPKTPPTHQKRDSLPTRPPPPKADAEKTQPKPEPTRPPPPKGDSEKAQPKLEPSRPLPPKAVVGKTEPKPEVKELSVDTVKPVPIPRQRSPPPEEQSHAPETKLHDQETPSQEGKRSASSPDTNFYRATSGYKAQNDKELSFSKGDVLVIVKKGNDRFHFGMLDDGTTGLFPLTVVEPFFN